MIKKLTWFTVGIIGLALFSITLSAVINYFKHIKLDAMLINIVLTRYDLVFTIGLIIWGLFAYNVNRIEYKIKRERRIRAAK